MKQNITRISDMRLIGSINDKPPFITEWLPSSALADKDAIERAFSKPIAYAYSMTFGEGEEKAYATAVKDLAPEDDGFFEAVADQLIRRGYLVGEVD